MSTQLDTAPDYLAHETALIEQSCSIGSGTKIGPFCHIMAGARIGKDCTIGQNVVIASTAILHDRVKIDNNVVIREGVVLEDEVHCESSVVFTAAVNPWRRLPGEPVPPSTFVRRGATLGANSAIFCGHTIREYAFVTPGSVVAHDILPYDQVAGAPAKHIHWLCRCGIVRMPLDRDLVASCTRCGRRYLRNGGIVQERSAVDDALGMESMRTDCPIYYPTLPEDMYG